MSEMYLTKVERKTIFTEALIYVLLMFIISDLTVMGPFWFNFIPWLLFIGIIGITKRIKITATIVICSFTIFISNIIKYEEVNLNVILVTISSIVTLALGAVIGKLIRQLVLSHRLVKFLPVKEKIFIIVVISFIAIISILMNSYISGDILTYSISKNHFSKYMESTYKSIDYKVKDVIFNRNIYNKYIYTITTDGQEVTFIPKSKLIYVDDNLNKRREKLNEELNNEFTNKIANIVELDFKNIEIKNLSVKYEYTEVSILPNIITLYVSNDDKDDNVYKEIVDLIDIVNNLRLSDFSKLGQVVIDLDNSVLIIKAEDFDKINEQYIKNGLNIEQLDSAY